MTIRITTGQRDREAAFICELTQVIPSITHNVKEGAVRQGIGDDAAVLRPSPRSEWAISTDFSLEGTHFRPDYPPDSIGYKSLARATSDLVAMGAKPRYFLLALALPTSKTGAWMTDFASGMSRATREFGSRLIGGDISRSALVTICVTVLGDIPSGLAVLRSGAKPGDLIYVTGKPGAAQLGLEITVRGLSHQPSLKQYLKPHLYPEIPTALGQALARQRIPSAMMDISDGLSTDLTRLCATSGVGAQIHVDRLPTVKVPSNPRLRGIDPLALALHGGDDYGLLFTAPPGSRRRLRGIPRDAQITHIGEITRDRQIVMIDHVNHTSGLEAKGWDPFRTRQQR